MRQKNHAGCLTGHYGAVLKQLRELKKLSQEELAFLTGLDRTYISLLERNRRQPSLATVEKIASALSVRTSRFLKMVEDACQCESKQKNQRKDDMPANKVKYEFNSRGDEKSGPFMVRMEEIGEGVYIVRFGPPHQPKVHPSSGTTLLSLEAVQFLGRLWGSGQIPEALRADYKAWLTKLESDLIGQNNGSSN